MNSAPTDAEVRPERDLLALDQQVCYALAVASRSVIGLYRPLLEPMGLTHPQYLVMLALWEQAPMKVNQLARRLSLEPATLSPMLKRLEANGMISRQHNLEDERALAVNLTAKGRKARDQAERVPAAIIKRLGMSIEELEELHRNLTRVIAACQD